MEALEKKVSVVLCTYNGARFLREQLESVVHQTYPLYELIAQDDGSTDGTLDILREYEQKYAFMKVYHNEDEHGVNGNFFSAMRRATGDFISICDQDDIWELNKIERQVEGIGDQLMCAHLTKPFSEDGSDVHFDPRLPNVGLLRTIYRPEIAGHSMLIRRDFLNLLPAKNDIYTKRMYDVILSLAAGAYERIVFLPSPFVNHRRYVSAVTYTSVKDVRPTMKNALHMLLWSLRHYREVKRISRPHYECVKNFLEALEVDSPSKQKALKMLSFELSQKWYDAIRFSAFCIRHRHEIFHTAQGGVQQWIRAALYPILACYHQRFQIKKK